MEGQRERKRGKGGRKKRRKEGGREERRKREIEDRMVVYPQLWTI